MLIKLYGEFWNPDMVYWGRRGGPSGHLRGHFSIAKKRKTADFWEAQGNYVLYDNFRVVYVGKAFSVPLGRRLRTHLTDRFAGRWDMFSWYSTSNYRKTTNSLAKAGARITSPDTIVKTLEALAIRIAQPPLNRKREKLPNAMLIRQATAKDSRSVQNYLEEILERLSN